MSEPLQSTRGYAEKLAKKMGLVIVPVDNSNSDLLDADGKIIASGLTIRLWHKVVELFKNKKKC